MGLFDKKQDTVKMQEEIRILATNIEALNQKLIQDPYAAITPGEAVIKKQTAECLERLKSIGETLKTRQNELRDAVNQQLTQIQSHITILERELLEFPKEREELSAQIGKLSNMIISMPKLDDKFYKEFIQRIEVFNKNANQLNLNLSGYYRQMADLLNKRINEIGEAVANKLIRNTAYFIFGMIFLSVLMTLLFTKVFLK